jgi:hypothetical protein
VNPRDLSLQVAVLQIPVQKANLTIALKTFAEVVFQVKQKPRLGIGGNPFLSLEYPFVSQIH